MGWLCAMVFPVQQGLFKFDVIDYCAILGVSVDADASTIRQRYLKIAYRLHPDTCKAETQSEKQRANDLLSQFVNPAYEQLSKEVSRQEFHLILTQISKDLPKALARMTLVSEVAKKLAQSTINVDLAYNKLLQSLAVDQYKTLDLIYQKIAQISELNLVYLSLIEGKDRKKVAQSASVLASVDSHSKSTAVQAIPHQEEPNQSLEELPISLYIRRAQNYLERNNSSQAILELKDALKIDPSDTICHALIGLAYLKQNQVSMAKVHINHAWNANPNDAVVRKSKEALDQVLPSSPATTDKKGKKNSSENSSSFRTIFGGKKNSAK
jgi:curved DNA-binding protein CbpA